MIMRLSRIGIIGASGYTGAELLRLAAQHPDLEVVVATATPRPGRRRALPSLAGAYPDLVFRRSTPPSTGSTSCSSACRTRRAWRWRRSWSGTVGCVVDLSAAFRLKDASLYPGWYGFEHDQPELLAEAVYGLPELHRDELKGARLVATPGCYVTAATLALAPLVAAGADRDHGHHRRRRHRRHRRRPQARARHAFCTVDENFTAYGLLDHRHTPEIEQEVGAQVLFTPHLAPMNRGILATCYARPTGAT